MFSTPAKHFLRRIEARSLLGSRVFLSNSTARFNSSSSVQEADEEVPQTYSFGKDGQAATDIVSFPVGGKQAKLVESQPVLLNSKEHAVGYLSRILNARVYEAALETELQQAENLSTVRFMTRSVFLQIGDFEINSFSHPILPSNQCKI